MVGTIAISKRAYAADGWNTRPVTRWEFAWTSDASGNADKNTQEAALGYVIGELVRVIFKPGTGGSQPSASYDIVLNDESLTDVLKGFGANLSNTATTDVSPGVALKDGTTVSVIPLNTNDVLDLVVSGAGASKSGTVWVYTR